MLKRSTRLFTYNFRWIDRHGGCCRESSCTNKRATEGFGTCHVIGLIEEIVERVTDTLQDIINVDSMVRPCTRVAIKLTWEGSDLAGELLAWLRMSRAGNADTDTTDVTMATRMDVLKRIVVVLDIVSERLQ